ncbi:hypothetical protein PA598K_04231 [Paenibacillus sp. 598K]|uniref:STM3941 family protein n=1 Tax=Paenibacillus sp. 598K TaxID=1117987 RepID=UPI000FFA80EA|nr:STM3941 family protein [Paenibacillus sp. 598K]GBF75799.1 hypothetical protein PA598K_04231 [Paenibacillus sp. 598K]
MSQRLHGAPIVEYPDRKRMFLFAFGSLVFVLIGGWMIVSGVRGEEPLLIAVIGLAAVLLFGLALLFYLYHLVKRQPTLRVDEEGLLDTSSLIAAGRISWGEISEVRLYTYHGERFIGINLHDPDGYLVRQGWLIRLFMRWNKRLVEAHVNIAQTGIATPLHVLYEEVRRRWLQATHAAEGKASD